MDTVPLEQGQKMYKKSCRAMIPPPRAGTRDYGICEDCRARDAASKKKRKREGALAEDPRAAEDIKTKVSFV